MNSGQKVIIGMGLLGIALLGGYELARRAATPRGVDKIEDRSSEAQGFDQILHFGGDRYRVRNGPEGNAPVGQIVVSKLGEGETDAVRVERSRLGEIGGVYLLELVAGGTPWVIATILPPEDQSPTQGLVFRLEGDEWVNSTLQPLPPEMQARFRGDVEFVQQGAFLYRKILVADRDELKPPFERKMFYDFQNERWEIAK